MAKKRVETSISNHLFALAVASIMLAVASITNCFSILAFGTFIIYIAALIVEIVAITKLRNESPIYKKAFALMIFVIVFYILGMILEIFSQTFLTYLAELLAMVCLSLINVMLVLAIKENLTDRGMTYEVSFGKIVFIINMVLAIMALGLRIAEMFPIGNLAYVICFYAVVGLDVVSYSLFAIYSFVAQKRI